MTTAQRLVVARETESGVQAGPDEMFDAALDGELEDADAPIDFCFLADGEAVQVYEDVGYGFEGGAKVGFGGARAEAEGDVGEG